jgi:hypothetical protein
MACAKASLRSLSLKAADCSRGVGLGEIVALNQDSGVRSFCLELLVRFLDLRPLLCLYVVDCCAVGWFAVFASVETLVSYVPPLVSYNCAGVEDRPEIIKWSKCSATISMFIPPDPITRACSRLSFRLRLCIEH